MISNICLTLKPIETSVRTFFGDKSHNHKTCLAQFFTFGKGGKEGRRLTRGHIP